MQQASYETTFFKMTTEDT